MKKLKYGMVFLALVGIGIVSCEKEELGYAENQTASNRNFDTRTNADSLSIGDVHNILVVDYFENGDHLNQTSLSAILIDYFDYHSNQNSAYSQFESVYLDAISNIRYANSIDEVYTGLTLELLELKNEERINTHDYGILSSILLSDSPAQESLNLSNTNMADAYSSVYSASSEFWTNGMGSDLLDNKPIEEYFESAIDPSVNAIIGDAVGGAMWFWTGPLGPLIAGAYSVGCYYSKD